MNTVCRMEVWKSVRGRLVRCVTTTKAVILAICAYILFLHTISLLGQIAAEGLHPCSVRLGGRKKGNGGGEGEECGLMHHEAYFSWCVRGHC